MTLCVYGVMLYDDLNEYPVQDTYVYLTRDAAQRRADRKTYEYAGVRYWACVVALRCAWDVSALGPFDGYESNRARVIDYAFKMKRERDRARDKNDKLRELVRQMSYAISPTSREHMLANLAEQGIEVN